MADAGMHEMIHVNGTGSASAPADKATVVVTASHSDADVSRALQVAAEAARSVVAVAAAHGVPAEGRRTTATQLQPERDSADWNRVVGYRASQTLRLDVADLAAVGPMLTEMAGTVGNNLMIDSVGLDIADTQGLDERAREAAFADARRKAEQLARLAGRELGRVVVVAEAGFPGNQPMPMARSFAAGAPSPSFEAGSQDVSVSLGVTFELR